MSSEVIGSIILMRHGARALNESAWSKLRKWRPESGGEEHAMDEWKHEELEHVTGVGVEQVEQLGKWYATQLISNAPRVVASVAGGSGRVRWTSSPTPRVVDSGHSFIKGMRSVLGDAVPLPTEPEAYPPAPHMVAEAAAAAAAATAAEGDAGAATPAVAAAAATSSGHFSGKLGTLEDAVFRAFLRPDHMKLVTATATSAEYAAAAAAGEAPQRLQAVYTAICGAPVVGSGPGQHPPALALAWTYYAQDVLDCEMNDEATALGIRNGLIHLRGVNPRLPSADSSSATSAACGGGGGVAAVPVPMPIPGVKARMLQRLTPADATWLAAASGWVWQQRYFSFPGAAAAGRISGAGMLRDIVADCLALATGGAVDSGGSGSSSSGGSKAAPIVLKTGHDHTIYATLAALRVRHPPPRPLGFAAHIILELRRDAAVVAATATAAAAAAAAAAAHKNGVGEPYRGLSLTARLCAEPFPHAATGHPTALDTSGTVLLFEELSLSSLVLLAEKSPKTEDVAAQFAVPFVS